MKQHGGTARRARNIMLAILFGVFLLVPRGASAATLFVAPSTGQFAVGQVFDVVVRVNSRGAAINASEGVLSFNPAQLQVQSITLTGSIFNLNIQEPEFSNTAGTVRWTGVILNPGYTGTSGNLITVRFKGIVPSTTTVTYKSGAVLANDGSGTNVLTGMSGGTYTIGPTTPVPKATPAATKAEGPVVTSTTHPDGLQCYNNNDPVFEWQLPKGVDAVSYLVNEKPTANPGDTSDGLVSRAAFQDLADGTSYFHLKLRSGGAWSAITHIPFSIDTTMPNAFTITREDASDTSNPRPLLSFITTDNGCGIDRYMMRIGEGEWFKVPESPQASPFALPLQAPGTRTVYIEAVDRAGNSTRATLDITVTSIRVPTITQYPACVPAGQTFSVSGDADPNVTVRVNARKSIGPFGGIVFDDTVVASSEAVSDALGHWTVSMPALKNAGYDVHAVSIDQRNAISDPSASVTIRVGFGVISRVLAFFCGIPWGWSWISILAWLLLILSLLLILFGLRRRKAAGPSRGMLLIKRNERKEYDKLQELVADIDDELLILEKMAKNRSLYPEEKYLRSKLLQYQHTIRLLMKNPRNRLAKRK